MGLRIPSLKIPNNKMRGIVSLYDITEDWVPIYDKSNIGGYYMAIGTSGNQFKNSLIAGKLMTKLIDYVENGNDHDVKPLQFKME
jgi:sarcosine oxidase subunit beta